KMPGVDEANAWRRRAAAGYAQRLADLPQVTVPHEADYAEHAYHQYTIRVPAADRDALEAHIHRDGIGCMIYYPLAVHHLPVYEGLEADCPITERVAGEVLSL